MRLPGFEPGLEAWKASVLDQTRPQPHAYESRVIIETNEAILKTCWENRNLKEVNTFRRRLSRLKKTVDLMSPLEVERYILNLPNKNSYKNVLLQAYYKFAKVNGIEWKPKRLRVEQFSITIPTEERINNIISCCTKKYKVIYNISKLGLRPDEISKIALRDLDLDRGELTVRTSKMGNTRTLKLRPELKDLLKEHVAKNKIRDVNAKLFPSPQRIKLNWRVFRKKAFEYFNDTELLKIRLYDLRHWFATNLYIKSRDIFAVKYALGHRSIVNTMTYVNLANAIVDYSDEYTCKIANNIQEASTLIESGFEYVTDFEGKKLFKKRK